MDKKGDLSIQVIVVAAIALIVLVVLVLIFTGQLGNFNRGSTDCAGLGGQCVAGPCLSENYPGVPIVQGKCLPAGSGQVCCKRP